ncbi:hypothetical protein AWH56_023480 [Anaerobacillus isosaccharinicus]|uniref:Uncharacterized protein n=1 Tax=Anaerobacillus isosaccharinicus TaxID=1532552 RepID=A0A1S2LIV2_9BACI|nr:hypothetical protein [Anaerobacillus isosaccharinicus]MBA5586133.1 hypothetical protein [Anaerobacillus isosaccharinicus]QOY35600.1 hypothetical protein AWH56_023480 [Anaerobacillus isosaccharinicus]
MQLDLLTVISTAAIAIVIFSPYIFRYNMRFENGKEVKLWVHLFSSKWFGATFIFLLLFGNYSEFTLVFVFNKITSTVIFSFFISLLGNFKLIISAQKFRSS